ncbi:lysophospholipid acyltransferase family protein [Nocardia brasiliensis]|uniref:1-acyl-sn-glycerol-3-phosphate acyltransferase n=1 Tax=Nocardia brasiliensis (strain ATCC 700358 / HUJEG-1) TaxID=1133849 RepID=K0ETD6_NOCB7|nr:lysophospholipid acyltransferase family protein [Nocardia brasiliensis]AFU03063.1 1-acyl-sn-glycerol-3-phosphate acyltransferase [Nocardia brasiliensis ATCC 700358]OCF84636.1 glycerol acyltransferase [Nocardia brasiliensis]
MKLPGLPADRIDRLADWVAHQVKSRVPAADPADRDPEFIIDTVGPAWLFARMYFRAEVRGLDHIPDEGPVLLVGNHSGGNVSPEVLVTTLAFVRRFGPHRPFFQLAHDMVMAYPVIGTLLRRFGTVGADPDSARQALRDGAAVLVYPGGDWEVHRPTWEEDQIDFAGRTGFLRLAWDARVPIVPFVNAGAQQTALMLSRGDRLARLLRLDQMLRLKVFPISLALPWGLNIGDLAGHIPLPSKVTIEFLPPIDLRSEHGSELDPDAAYDHVTGVMQDALTRLCAERGLPILG